MENGFKFELNSTVEIACSGEIAKVTGRAEYSEEGKKYLLLYKSATGQGVETWWPEYALQQQSS